MVLVDRMRAAPMCEACGGHGRVRRYPPAPSQINEAGGPLPTKHCGACAGMGSPFSARVEFAAYCGDRAAHSALGRGQIMDDAGYGNLRPSDLGPGEGIPFNDWVRGLSRWADVGPVPEWVLVLAVRAASGTLHAAASPPDWLVEDALNACDLWLERPTRANAMAWGRAACAWSGRAGRWGAGADRRYGVCVPFPGTIEQPDPRSSLDWDTRIRDGARLVGEAPVRSAICSSLVRWALGDS